MAFNRLPSFARAVLATSTVVAIPLLSACGVGGESASCDFREEMVNGIRCQQRDGFQAFGFLQACEASGGDPIDGPCPDEGKVKGCVFDSSADVVDWYYEPMSLDEIERQCEGDGELIDP